VNKQEFDTLMTKCQKAANKAAEKTLQKLKDNRPGASFLDSCGGAWITISDRNTLVLMIKKNTPNTGSGPGINSQYESENGSWDMTKGMFKGYNIHINYTLRCRQEVSVHEAANEAASKVLEEEGIKTHVHSYIN